MFSPVSRLFFNRFSSAIAKPCSVTLKFIASRGTLFKSLTTSASFRAMNLSSVIHYLEDGAPTTLAENWDNVGLLVEPSPPHTVHNILMTNDLTLDVCEEAIECKADLILSYHPPIFSGMKTLTQKSVKERIVVKCIENRIAVYSPHTIMDNIKNGVNQWIIDSFNEFNPVNIQPLHKKLASSTPGGASHLMTLILNPKADLLLDNIRGVLDDDTMMLLNKTEDGEKLMVTLRLNEYQMSNVTELLGDFPGVLDNCVVSKLEALPLPGYGGGLKADIDGQMTLESAVQCIKKQMNLERVRLAVGRGKNMESGVEQVAVCAGSGRSVLAGCPADLYITGEMSHHDILDCTENSISLVLTEHSNCERGFLTVLKDRLEKKFEKTEVSFKLSKKDRDPLVIV